MITVQNDWIEYATVAVRPLAVRGGSTCAQRPHVAGERPRPAAPVRLASAQAPRAAASRPRDPAAIGPGQRRPAPRLRLTRRGRVVLVVLPSVLAATAALVSLTAPLAEAQPSRPAATVVVGTGDTLWSIAGRIAPQVDPRDVVVELERVNHLPGAAVQAGERLVLPGGLGR